MIQIIVWALGCTGAPADTGVTDTAAAWCATQPDVTWKGWADGFFTTYCLGCHSVYNTDARFDAPPGVNFDTEADVLRQADRVRARVLVDETMPVGGGVYADDRQLLDVYLTCGR